MNTQTLDTGTKRAARPQPERRLDVLMHVSRAIGTIRDQDRLMNVIMDEVTAAFSADRSTLYLHDPRRCELWTRVAQCLDSGTKELRVPDDHGLCGRVFQTREPMCISDTTHSPHFARDVASSTNYMPHSMLIVPVIQASGTCTGILQLMDRRFGHFSEDDVPLLEAIAVQVAISLENAELYKSQKRQFNSFVSALSEALDARDPLTAIHSINVANYAMGIAQILGLPPADLEWLRIAGLLHDVGKIGVPEAVLTKPGRLLPEEFEEMKRHALYTRNILSKIEFSEELKGMELIAPAHHEKLDGSGYPDGLVGSDIPLFARILAVADIFDALTQTRHYRQGMMMHDALHTMDKMTPHQLDASCVAALKAFLGRGPWPAV